MLRLKTALTNKITEDNIQGSPDLIVEVISEGSEVKDRREKKNLYEKFGVKEYILVFPGREYAERYYLKKGKFRSPCPECSYRAAGVPGYLC